MKEMFLVLLPGMDGTGVLFEPLVKELPHHITPIVVTYPPDTPMTYEQLLPLVMASLPKQAPFVLLGESFSGPLSIMAAAANPPNLKALILCATFIRKPLPWLPRWLKHLAGAPLFSFTRPFILVKALVAGYGSAAIIALLRKAHGMVAPDVMAARAREILAVDAENALQAVSAPVFFVGGASDKVSPPKNLREIVTTRPDVQIHLIPGPHLILQTQPSAAADVIDSIIQSL